MNILLNNYCKHSLKLNFETKAWATTLSFHSSLMLLAYKFRNKDSMFLYLSLIASFLFLIFQFSLYDLYA